MTYGPEWWQRVQSLQNQLYQLRERALSEGDRETADECKHLLHESERLFKRKAQSWMKEAEQLLDESGDSDD